MKVYLQNWTPLKRLTNPRQISVFSQFELTNQNINLRSIQNNVANGEIIIEYEIAPGAINGIIRLQEDIVLHRNWNELGAAHKIIIRSVENEVTKDDESMDTIDVPTI